MRKLWQYVLLYAANWTVDSRQLSEAPTIYTIIPYTYTVCV